MSTLRKSQATMPAACRRRNDRQVVEAGRGAGWETVGAQDPGDGAGGDPAAKLQQLPADALVAPAWVLGGQPNDQALQLVGNWRSAAWPGWIDPMSAHHAAVPSKQRLGRDQEAGPSGPGQQAAQGGQQRAVLGLEAEALGAGGAGLSAGGAGPGSPPLWRPSTASTAPSTRKGGIAPGRRTTRPPAPPTGRQHAMAHHSRAVTCPLTPRNDFWHPTPCQLVD